MANPQRENGFTPIANEVIEELVKAGLLGSELSMVLFVIRKTWGYQKKSDIISYSQFEKGLGISRVTVSKTIKNLVSKKILVKSPILVDKISFSFNKNYETWVVNTPILVKSKGFFGKGGYTKTSKGGYTHKRKKEITKERILAEPSSAEIVLVIDSFEETNPSYKKWYGNTTQRGAIKRMLDIHGIDKLLKVTALLPRTKGQQYFPTITTPLQLEDKWASLESAFIRYKGEKINSKNKVAFK